MIARVHDIGMDTNTSPVVVAYPWEGPKTYVRIRVTRGSAAGAHERPRHIMAGRDGRGRAITKCGLTIEAEVLSRDAGPIGACQKCQRAAVAP